MMMRRLHFTLALGALFLYSSATALSRKSETLPPPTAPSAASAPPAPAAPGLIVEAPRAAEPSPAPPRLPRKRRGGMDVTFLVTADTHLGFDRLIPIPAKPSGVSIEDVHEMVIDTMNTIEGKPFPRAIGGTIGAPRGVLVAGDLTEYGWPHEWDRFESLYGLTGKEGRLRFPVYEGAGNHDKAAGHWVEDQIARRHGANRYSWDWDDLHIVCLGEAPNDDDLAWLREDLAATGRDVGVVLYFHFPLEGSYSTGQWFGDGDYRRKLHEVIKSYRVLGIFTGHYHATGLYRWRGIDAYLVGSAKHSFHSFAVVRVTDTRMTVASYNYDRRDFWWWHDRPIFGAKGSEARWFSPNEALVGSPRGR